MIKGLYTAASAMIAGTERQMVKAHNVANLDTPGFKSVMNSVGDFLKAPVIHPPQEVAGSNSLHPIGHLGLGVETTPVTTDFSLGPLKLTDEPLDFAINGPGFFRIHTPDGERLTRDGRFSRDLADQLVTVDGYQVLDESGQAILLPSGSHYSLTATGELLVDGVSAGQLGVLVFEDPATQVERTGSNTFIATGTSGEQAAAGAIQQGVLEMSNVNTAKLMASTSNYEAAQKMVRVQDELLGRAISSLGRLG